jgi:DNA repair protein RadC
MLTQFNLDLAGSNDCCVNDFSRQYITDQTLSPKSLTSLLTSIEVWKLDSKERSALYKLTRDLALYELAQKDTALTSPSDAFDYLRNALMGLEHEVFGLVFLDNKQFIIENREMASGTIDSAIVYPRELVKAALELNASAVIAYHNHPSGNNIPSQADRAITERIKTALDVVDIRFLDHVIVSKDGHFSFAEKNLM